MDSRPQRAGGRTRLGKRGQVTIEYLILLSITLTVLVIISISIGALYRKSTEMVNVVQARSAVELLASTSALVGAQGCPARKTVQALIPTGTVLDQSFIGSRTGEVGRIINIHVVTPYGEEDVWMRASTNIKGDLPNATGYSTFTLQNTGGHVVIGRPEDLQVPTTCS